MKNKWKYARLEYERRFLLAGKPSGLGEANVKTIRDKYFENTTLRLRQVRQKDQVHYKLTQKRKIRGDEFPVQKITSIYLTESEFNLFDRLPGLEIVKKRYLVEIDQIPVGFDEIALGDHTLWIAEIEFADEPAMKNFQMPLPYQDEITDKEDYSGYEFARKYRLG